VKRIKASASPPPSLPSSQVRIGVCRQPASITALTVTVTVPRSSAARRALPSSASIDATTVLGSIAKWSSPGLPQTGEMHISWRCS
jgi:hypothetical protein